MNLQETRARENRRTQAAPVDLEHGRFQPDQVVQLYIVAAIALAAGAVGGVLMSWGLAGAGSTWGWLATLSTWIAIFGGLLALLSFGTAGAISFLAASGWWRHQARVDDWHFAQLAAYEHAGGQEIEREVLQRSLSLSEPLHALAVALHVVERARAGEPTPWASTKLRGVITYGHLSLGELSKTDAEAWSLALADVGIVRGRRKGYAGELAVQSEGEVLQLVSRNWGKIAPGKRRQLDAGDDSE